MLPMFTFFVFAIGAAVINSISGQSPQFIDRIFVFVAGAWLPLYTLLYLIHSIKLRSQNSDEDWADRQNFSKTKSEPKRKKHLKSYEEVSGEETTSRFSSPNERLYGAKIYNPEENKSDDTSDDNEESGKPVFFKGIDETITNKPKQKKRKSVKNDDPFKEEEPNPKELQFTPEEQPKTKECPFCAETIKFKAIKCRYCHEMLGNAE